MAGDTCCAEFGCCSREDEKEEGEVTTCAVSLVEMICMVFRSIIGAAPPLPGALEPLPPPRCTTTGVEELSAAAGAGAASVVKFHVVLLLIPW